MGGVINIVTRKMQEDGVDTHLHAGYGSYNTLETELTNRVRKDGSRVWYRAPTIGPTGIGPIWDLNNTADMPSWDMKWLNTGTCMEM